MIGLAAAIMIGWMETRNESFEWLFDCGAAFYETVSTRERQQRSKDEAAGGYLE